MRVLSLRDHYKIEPLSSAHDRASFSCGNSILDRYLKQQASQDSRRGFAAVFVVVESSSGALHGFYSLSMASVPLDLLPAEIAQKMPRYPTVPAVRLGRLALNRDMQGKGIGTHLMMDAISRSLMNEIAWAAFVVEAKNGKARDWYTNFGFRSFIDNKYHLYLIRKTIESLRLN
jgi:GNAT superfamily N-acetyltransferase